MAEDKEISVQEEKTVEDVRLTAEEVAVREQALADMTVKTMKRRLFDTLLPALEGPTWSPWFTKERSVAMIVAAEKGDRRAAYLMMDDQTLVSIGSCSVYGVQEHSFKGEWAWVRDLPVIHVV